MGHAHRDHSIITDCTGGSGVVVAPEGGGVADKQAELGINQKRLRMG